MANPPSEIPLPSTSTHLSNLTILSVLSRPGPRRPALPLELILEILSYPAFWILADHLKLNSSVQVSSRIGTKILLRTKPFSQKLLSSLRKITFTLCSRDQGWSSYYSAHGTFENSWTWFSMAIVNEARSNGEPGNQLDQHTQLPDNHHMSMESESNATDPYEFTDANTYILQRNRHASRMEENYRIEMKADEGPLKELEAGDEIILLACARYGGWENIVKEAGIEIWTMDDVTHRTSPIL